jgi:hypothetical protein
MSSSSPSESVNDNFHLENESGSEAAVDEIVNSGTELVQQEQSPPALKGFVLPRLVDYASQVHLHP